MSLDDCSELKKEKQTNTHTEVKRFLKVTKVMTESIWGENIK